MKPLSALLLGLAAAGLTAGCGGGNRKYDVTGEVKYDGQPVPDGQVIFTPADGAGTPEGGPIKNGRYTIHAAAGRNKVQIRGSRVVPGKKGPMGEEFVEAFIPDKYDAKSTLTAEVGPDKTKHDFDLPK